MTIFGQRHSITRSRRPSPKWLLIVAVLNSSYALAVAAHAQQPFSTIKLTWASLPPIPDHNGFASPFAGVNYGALIVAGGSNFPDKKLWEGGSKAWYDSVFVLEGPNREWKQVGKLPRPIAGGVSVSTRSGVACIGGGDATKCYDDCFLLKVKNGSVITTPLPSLPKPCANAAGILVGDTIYIAGGIERPDAMNALNTFWALDLRNTSAGWQQLPTWPGPSRMLATIGAQDGAIYLFSGTDLKPGGDGKPERVWLKDAFKYRPKQGWTRMAELPRVAVAAPSPAPEVGSSQLLVLGGDDGEQAKLPQQTHTGFRGDILAYNTASNTWSTFGELPFGLVTTPAVRWQNRIVIPGGEERPCIRSNKVWATTIEP